MTAFRASAGGPGAVLPHRIVAEQVLQEGRVRRQDQRGLIVERHLVRLEGPQELVELRILPKGLGIDPRGLGVALAAQLGGVALGDRHDDQALPIGGRSDSARLLLALGAKLQREAVPLGAHTAVHLRQVRFRIDGAADAKVEHLYSVRPESLDAVAGNGARDLLAFRGEQVGERMPRQRLLNRAVRDGVQPSESRIAGADALEVALRVGDPPYGVVVDFDQELLARLKLEWIPAVVAHPPLLVAVELVDERDPDVPAGPVEDGRHVARARVDVEAEHDGVRLVQNRAERDLALVDDDDAERGCDAERGQQQGNEQAASHRTPSLLPSGRYGSTRSVLPCSMITLSISGRISSSVSM